LRSTTGSDQSLHPRSFRMSHDVVQSVFISFNAEIESPIFVHSALPNVIGFIVFLGSERRMLKVFQEKARLLRKGFLHRGGSTLEGFLKALRIGEFHFLERFLVLPFKDAIMSPTEPKGPRPRPALKSARLSARCRSTTDFGVRVILPFSTLASRTSPILTPARSRTAVGKVTWNFVLTLTIAILMIC
jgi:hypothetical protein